MPQATAQATIVLLWVLYFVQGLPFGFQSKSLPLLLRERGFDLRHIGYANLLSLPWTWTRRGVRAAHDNRARST